MTARRLAPLLALGLLAATPAAAQARRCGALHGRDLVGVKTIKVVHAGSRYLGCTMPQGPVRSLGRGPLTMLDAQGGHVITRDRRTGHTVLWDLPRAAHRRLARLGVDARGPVAVVKSGQAAFMVTARPSGITRVFGMDFNGATYRLGDGAIPGTLKRRGHTISWDVVNGHGRADLLIPAVPCEQLAGTEDKALSTPRIRVVSYRYLDEYLVGEMDGIATRTRACLRGTNTIRTAGVQILPRDVQGGDGFAVLASGGTSILEHTATSDSQGDFTPSRYVLHDLTTDARTPLFGNADAKGPNTALGSVVDDRGWIVSDTNRAAAVFATDSGAESVVAFDAQGHPVVLDTDTDPKQIDERSLKADGASLTWTHGGAPRSAPMP